MNQRAWVKQSLGWTKSRPISSRRSANIPLGRNTAVNQRGPSSAPWYGASLTVIQIRRISSRVNKSMRTLAISPRHRPRQDAARVCTRKDLAVPHESLWCRCNKLEVFNRAESMDVRDYLRRSGAVRERAWERGAEAGDCRVIGVLDERKLRNLSANNGPPNPRRPCRLYACVGALAFDARHVVVDQFEVLSYLRWCRRARYLFPICFHFSMSRAPRATGKTVSGMSERYSIQSRSISSGAAFWLCLSHVAANLVT
jgi:hypothetical protein